MTGQRYSYALHVLREDGSAVAQVPVDVDWGPAREWVRLLALRRGSPPAEAFARECVIEPLWHAVRGAPYLAGFRARVEADGRSAGNATAEPAEPWHDFTTAYFSRVSGAASARLVEEGALREGERFLSLPVAFPRDDAPEGAAPALRLNARPAAPVVPIRPGRLGDLLERSVARGSPGDDGDLPVFVPRAVLEEAASLARAAEAKETGGILVGDLHRDPDTAGVFAAVTAQIPARHAKADLTSLSFTPEVWTDVRAALALRHRGEIMLGWWHSHPVREWCKGCSEESRRRCSLAADFFSDHDRALHRTVFPRAYSLGLVVNDVAADAPTFSLFGWRGGLIEPRGFHVLEQDRPHPEIPAATASASAGGMDHGG